MFLSNEGRRLSQILAPMPIAFCITGLQPGGAERALVQIVKRLNREKWDPVVYSLTGTGPLEDDLQSGQHPVQILNDVPPGMYALSGG